MIPKSYSKLMGKAKVRDKVPQMKAAWSTLNKCLTDIQHVVMFEELPNSQANTKDNLESFVKDIARSCDRINCEIETYKAIMKAKSV